ncbi:hypothetical protein Thimo_2396 [Thioflavicoccus mobilis 8321]|uniref:CHRD domain-containing protein n=1 Tax=Thioflavicoccus mobilis 8321 TaxID=765912 RepID=L0GZ71_9GAMM|nr:hypothetical protein [Thioflavicoccus mobilis]AGA91132.1 hypothetical protein Thimo_2396 [Thioflavicoccus mobilis 8321]
MKSRRFAILTALLAILAANLSVSADDQRMKIVKEPENSTALLVTCYSYYTPDSINAPSGTVTVAGLLPSDPSLTVDLTILWGMPSTATLHGTGKLVDGGVNGSVRGALYELGKKAPIAWIDTTLELVYPADGEKGTLSMPKVWGEPLTVIDGCTSQ